MVKLGNFECSFSLSQVIRIFLVNMYPWLIYMQVQSFLQSSLYFRRICISRLWPMLVKIADVKLIQETAVWMIVQNVSFC